MNFFFQQSICWFYISKVICHGSYLNLKNPLVLFFSVHLIFFNFLSQNNNLQMNLKFNIFELKKHKKFQNFYWKNVNNNDLIWHNLIFINQDQYNEKLIFMKMKNKSSKNDSLIIFILLVLIFIFFWSQGFHDFRSSTINFFFTKFK